jgi:tetratricopeptide (TPR) repeat protein
MPDGDVDTEDDWRTQGELLLMRNRYTEALDRYTQTLEHHPDEPAAWVGKARALLGLDRPEAALTAADQALTLDAGYAPGYRARGASLCDLRRYDEAMTVLTRYWSLIQP